VFETNNFIVFLIYNTMDYPVQKLSYSVRTSLISNINSSNMRIGYLKTAWPLSNILCTTFLFCCEIILFKKFLFILFLISKFSTEYISSTFTLKCDTGWYSVIQCDTVSYHLSEHRLKWTKFLCQFLCFHKYVSVYSVLLGCDAASPSMFSRF
jgi:hypothetical protein